MSKELNDKIIMAIHEKKEELNRLLKSAANEGLAAMVQVDVDRRPSISIDYPMIRVMLYEPIPEPVRLTRSNVTEGQEGGKDDVTVDVVGEGEGHD